MATNAFIKSAATSSLKLKHLSIIALLSRIMSRLGLELLHRPVFPGHCLLIPKAHFETLTDLPEDLIGPFFKNVQLLSRAVESAMEAHGTFVAMNNRVSQSVPHLHTHIVPRRRKDGLKGFFWPRQPYKSEEEAESVQEKIRKAVAELSK